MASFELTPGAWVLVVAPAAAKDTQIQITAGRAFINFGVPDANSSPIVASIVENKMNVVPAGQEVWARSSGPRATVTTGDY